MKTLKRCAVLYSFLCEWHHLYYLNLYLDIYERVKHVTYSMWWLAILKLFYIQYIS